MDTIDQRILIPAPPDLVWDYTSDISRNPEWQVNCVATSYLSTHQSGKGVRWRHTTARRKDLIIEASAWYDGLGYEYSIVDGSPYTENRGRLRLQEVAEGTVVQWTFSYKVGGVFGSLRNSLSSRRSIENNIVESLWNLWRKLINSAEGAYTSKSLMRAAPDVEARSHYQPKHRSVLADRKRNQDDSVAEPTIAEKIAAEEPPVSVDDTRPREAEPVAEPIPDTVREPEFLSEVSSEPYPPETGVASPPEDEMPITASQPEIAAEDSSSVSVFDVFGVAKPSNTSALPDAPAESATETPPIEPATEATPESAETEAQETRKREGLRSALRRSQAGVRHPNKK